MKRVHTGVMVAALAVGGLVAFGVNAGGGVASKAGHGERTKAMDTDSNGTLTRAEVEAFERASAAELDLDGDGAVTAAEMKAYREAQRAQRETQRMARLDSNKDGKVSVEEIAASRADWIMKRDADNNGELSADEMSRGGHRGRRGHH